MIEKLKEDPAKIPAPKRNQMMSLFEDAWKTTYQEVNNVAAYKSNMITIALDGSEEALASRNLISGLNIEFQASLLLRSMVTFTPRGMVLIDH